MHMNAVAQGPGTAMWPEGGLGSGSGKGRRTGLLAAQIRLRSQPPRASVAQVLFPRDGGTRPVTAEDRLIEGRKVTEL